MNKIKIFKKFIKMFVKKGLVTNNYSRLMFLIEIVTFLKKLGKTFPGETKLKYQI
jgi:hypothetical protein